jgi:hypothetical protein
MKTSTPLFSSTRLTFRCLGIFGIVVVIALAVFYVMPNHNRFLMAGLTGVQHMGEDFNIAVFYVDGYSGGNVGREGGGGSNVCCVMLPEKWRTGLVVELRWSVSDWSKENKEETANSNYRSVIWKSFKALVPVEKYDGKPGRLYVHFFAGGKARVVASSVGPDGVAHPIQRNDPHAAKAAMTGLAMPAIFTDAELGEMDRKIEERKAKYGSWR